MLLAHAAAVRLYREKYQKIQRGKIGITLSSDGAAPLTNKTEDIEATERQLIFSLGWHADPVFKGDYPEVMKANVKERLPKFTEEQKKLLNGSADFFALNHYTTRYVSHGTQWLSFGWYRDKNTITHEKDSKGNIIGKRHAPTWCIAVPWGFKSLLKWVANRYNNPEIIVTENGMGNYDEGPIQEQINDLDRVEYYKTYVSAMVQAREEGVNVKGYFAWSMMDNFEWQVY